MIRLPLRSATIGLVMVLLTGCALPQSTPSASSRVSQATSSNGLALETISNDDPRLPVRMEWPVVPGADALTALMRSDAEARSTEFFTENPPTDEAPPELNSTWEWAIQSDTIQGVRLTTNEFAGASWGSDSAVYYGDTHGGAWRSPDLISEGSRAELVNALRVTATAAGLAPSAEAGTDAASRNALLADLSFASGTGDLVAAVPAGVMFASGKGIVTLTVASAKVAPWLTDAGRSVQKAMQATASRPTTSAPAAPATTAEAAPTTTAPAVTATSPVDCSKLSCVALTFDDGPGPYTAHLLDILASKGVHATFFVIGSAASARPDLIRREVTEGHVVANHTQTHTQLTKLPRSGQQSEVDRASAAIVAAGAPAPVLMRPPYGSLNADTKTLGMPLVLWDVDPLDWKDRNTAIVTQRVVAGAKKGSIILLHDIHPTSVEAVPGIIDALKAKGLTFVTVPQLFGTMTPGAVYTSRTK